MAASIRKRISRATKVALGRVIRDSKRAVARSSRNAFRNRSVLAGGLGVSTVGSIARGAGGAILRSTRRNLATAARRIGGAISRATRAFFTESGRRSNSARLGARLAGGFAGG